VGDVRREPFERARHDHHRPSDFGMTYAGFAVGKQVVITIDAVGMNTAAGASPE
jgi:hypothetical protein